MLRTANVLGRSEKTAPFWMRAWWAREWLPTKMEGREPMERVMSGPYLDLRFLRMGSNSEREFVSSRKLEERSDGPGGSLLPSFRWKRRDLIRAATQRETMMTNQVSMVDG
ncbi:hypothetical protein L2E82_14080 [Cichorium intybus]|uniref:Uncharacterized protein n=1 Tax=Cichorium intybus TaxID=13427 RepID=A0ACB9EZH0_CICIN|nr:hypothetical protein L2E82_14080 [Cichorium intybus]